MPLYAAEIEAEGVPDSVHSLYAQFATHEGIFIATPEYNAFPSSLLLNALDWRSRVRHHDGGKVEAFEIPVFAIGAASPSPVGGYRGLTAFCHNLSLGLGAYAVPAMVAVAAAYQASNKAGGLVADHDKAAFGKLVGQLIGKAGN